MRVLPSWSHPTPIPSQRPQLNTITQGKRASTYKFWEDTNIPLPAESRALHYRGRIKPGKGDICKNRKDGTWRLVASFQFSCKTDTGTNESLTHEPRINLTMTGRRKRGRREACQKNSDLNQISLWDLQVSEHGNGGSGDILNPTMGYGQVQNWEISQDKQLNLFTNILQGRERRNL